MLLLFACSKPEEPTAEPAPYEPAAWVMPDGATPVPTLSPGSLAAAIGEAAARVRSSGASPVLAAWDEAMAGADTCPMWFGDATDGYWLDTCTSAAGTTFSGYAALVAWDAASEGTGLIRDGRSIAGVASVTSADGTRLDVGGAARVVTFTPEGVAPGEPAWYGWWQSVVDGSFAYDGPAGEGTWLADGETPALSAAAYHAPAHDLRYLAVEGSLPATGDASAVVFDGLVVMNEALEPDCREAAGVVSVRDADGVWYDVVFDGPAAAGDPVDLAACDGCGAAWLRGEPAGEVCPDLSPLLAWETTPW